MIYHIRAISNESDDFLFDIAIDSGVTFQELHDFIQEKLDYDPSHLSSFFITDREWNKEVEVVAMDMGDGSMGEVKLMEEATLEELLLERKERFIYVYDIFNERILFMELIQIDKGNLSAPVATTLKGDIPPQIIDEEEDDMMDIDFEDDYYDDEDDYFSDDIDLDSLPDDYY